MHTLKFYVFAGEFPALLQHDCDARANSERPRGMYQLTYKLQSIVFADSSSIVYLILCERQHCMEKSLIVVEIHPESKEKLLMA